MEGFETLLNEDIIKKRTKELANKLYDIYKNEEVVFICTLKGAVFFCCDLMKNYQGNAYLEFIKISSYHGDKTTGDIQLNLSVDEKSIKDKNVIIIEDIVDKGYSLKYLYDILNKLSPKSIISVALLDKKICRKVDIDPTYSGFIIDDLFVIGYGLDYNQKYRNLSDIKVLKKSLD